MSDTRIGDAVEVGTQLEFLGLDGSNPLGFLAALGVLNVVADATPEGVTPPLLSWRLAGRWRPRLWTAQGLDEAAVIQAVVDELPGWADEPAIALHYSKDKKGKGGEEKEALDLKPPPAIFRKFLADLLEGGSARSLSYAAAFATDVAVDGTGNTKPTALHFTAGQQEFLRMVRDLVAGVNAADVEESLFGPWRYERPLPVLQWDATASRDYALRAGNPALEKKAGVPGADWLAFRGLPFMRVVPVGNRAMTTGVSGGWKKGRLRWPLWTVGLTRETIRTVVQMPGLREMSQAERRGRGIGAVLESRIRRSDQGGYGSFAPAAVV